MMARKMTLSVANMAVGTVLGLVAAHLIARHFGNANFGEVQFALSILGLLFFITDLGMGQAHVKRVSEGRDPGDCFATFAVFKLVATGVFVLLALLVLWGYTLTGRTIEDTSWMVILFSLAYYVAKAFQDIGQSSFDARLETAKSQLATFLDTAVRTGLTILFAYVVAASVHGVGPFVGALAPDSALAQFARERPAALLAVANALGAIAAATAALILLRRGLERGRFRWDLLKDYASFAFPLFLTTAIGVISINIDGAVLGVFLSKAEVGLFGQAKRLPLALGGIGVATSILLFPTLSRLAAANDRAAIDVSMDRAHRWLSMLMTPLLLFSAIFAADLLRIFLSDEVVPGATAMALLCGYVFLTTVAIPHSNLLLGVGRPDVVARIGLASSVTLIVLNLLLVPYDVKSVGLRLGGLGIEGAAVATLASGLVWYGSLRLATRRLAGHRERGHFWIHLASGAAMIGLLVLLDRTVFPLERIWHLPVYGLIGAVVYFVMLLLLRGFTRDDWRVIRESVHPIEMLRYIRDELRRKRQ